MSKKRKTPATKQEGKDDATFYLDLCRTKAEDFAIGGPALTMPIFFAKRDDNICNVWKGLIEKNFMSVPVMLEDGSYFGFLTVADIVKYITEHFKAKSPEQTLSNSEDYWALIHEEKEFATKTVNDLMTWPHMRKNPFHPIAKGYSAFAVFEALARQPGLHRVPIVDSDRTIVNLVTQSQVIQYLHANLDKLGSRKDKLVSECEQFLKPVISVKESEPAHRAFELMIEHQITGVPVVNEDGKLTGHLSLRDMKLIAPDATMFMRLQQTVHNFIPKLRHEFQEKHGRPRTMVCVVGSDSMGKVITQLAEHRIHRVCIVDAKKTKNIIGIITLQDVLLQLLTV